MTVVVRVCLIFISSYIYSAEGYEVNNLTTGLLFCIVFYATVMNGLGLNLFDHLTPSNLFDHLTTELFMLFTVTSIL